MKKKIITWSIALLAILLTLLLYFFYIYDWGNAKSDVHKTKTELSSKTNTSKGKKINEIPSEIKGIFKSEPVDFKTSEILFTIEGMKKTVGKFKDFEILYTKQEDQLGKLEVTIKVASIYTANSLRDKHIKGENFFNIATYPEITFNSTSITISDTSYLAKGELNFLGVKSEISIPFNFAGLGKGENTTQEERLIFEGKFDFDRVQLGMKEEDDVGNIAHVSFYTELVR